MAARKPNKTDRRSRGTLDKGAVQSGGRDKGAVQSAPADNGDLGPVEMKAGGAGYRIDAEGVVVPNEVEAAARSTPSGAIRPTEDQIDPDDAIHQASSTETAMDVEPGLRGSGEVSGSSLVADPDYRITLSDPRVQEQAGVSKAKLEQLLDKLKGVHGEDAGLGPEANTEEVPLSEADLQVLRAVVEAAIALHRAPTLPRRAVEALKNLYETLVGMKARLEEMAATFRALKGLAFEVSEAVLAIEGLLHLLGVT